MRHESPEMDRQQSEVSESGESSPPMVMNIEFSPPGLRVPEQIGLARARSASRSEVEELGDPGDLEMELRLKKKFSKTPK